MAAEQEIVLRLDGQGVAHEGARVEDQGARHAAGYAVYCYFSRQTSPTRWFGGQREREREREKDQRDWRWQLAGGKKRLDGGREGGLRYISGSFCVSMTAAMGMPKLETGPQKSGGSE